MGLSPHRPKAKVIDNGFVHFGALSARPAALWRREILADNMKQKPSGPSRRPGTLLPRRRQRRVTELAAANRPLPRGPLRRQSRVAALKKSGARYAGLLQDSLQLEGLRQLTRQALGALEDERQKISRRLQNEIAQTLLGVHVRLLNLRKVARGNKTNLAREIAGAQRVVQESVKSINRFARELNLHQPA